MKNSKNKKGILLFEVLLALLILSIGITTSLQAFRSIIQITKHSRDYFETQFVAADIMFHLFAIPDEASDMMLKTGTYEFQNKNISLHNEFRYQLRAQEVELPFMIDEGADEASDAESLLRYQRITSKIMVAQDVLFEIDTFHATAREDE